MAADQGHSGVVGMYRSVMTAARRKADGLLLCSTWQIEKELSSGKWELSHYKGGLGSDMAQGRGFNIWNFR